MKVVETQILFIVWSQFSQVSVL